MKRTSGFGFALWAVGFACQFIATEALAIQFPVLDPGYNQEIYAGGPLAPGGGAGMAWGNSNQLLTRHGSNIVEYSLTQTPNAHQGTALHLATATHPITGLNSTGHGMTNGLDGYIYTVTSGGLQRFNPANWAAPAQSLPGTAGGLYGITTMPDGRIAYTDSGGNSNVYIYDPVLTTNTLIYTTSNSLVDGMVSGPAGNIAITGQTDGSITILTSAGAVVNSFSTLPHYPDGLAFSETVSSSTLYSNNNDGTISRYVFGPGYTGVPVISLIASGAGAYGDLASVGPDCAFYVSQFENGSYHGATPGVGTNWDNAVTNAESSITRIGILGVSSDGTPPGEVCDLYTPYHGVPEPATLGILAIGVVGLGTTSMRRRRRSG